MDKFSEKAWIDGKDGASQSAELIHIFTTTNKRTGWHMYMSGNINKRRIKLNKPAYYF